jgi:hypothetical protein
MVSPAGSSRQGQASYQRILVKTKTSPKGLGAIKPAHRGGLTSCTQQRTQGKNSYQTAPKRAKISSECSSDQGEQTHKEKFGEIKTST